MVDSGGFPWAADRAPGRQRCRLCWPCRSANAFPPRACLPAADFPAAPLFDPREGKRLSEASSWRSAHGRGLAVSEGPSSRKCWQRGCAICLLPLPQPRHQLVCTSMYCTAPMYRLAAGAPAHPVQCRHRPLHYEQQQMDAAAGGDQASERADSLA